MKVLRTIEDHLSRIELVHRDRVALVEEVDLQSGSGREITYSRLVQWVRAQGAGLDHLGVGRNDRVAIVSRSSGRLLSSFLAVSGTGRVLVPIDVRMSVRDIAGAIEHSGATMLLIDPEFDNTVLHGLTGQRYLLGTEGDDAELYRFGVEAQPCELDDEATAILDYAKGRAEPLALTHRDLQTDLAAFGWQLELNERDVYLHTVPLCQNPAWGFVYALTAMGGRHVGFEKIDGIEILRRIDAHGVTLMDGAPAVGMMVLGEATSWDGPVPGHDRLRVVLTGPPPPTIERLGTELGWTLVQVSGLSEPSPVPTPSGRDTDEVRLAATGLAAGG